MTLWITLGLLVGLIVAAIKAGKHRTVRAIDVAGLNFLSPVVRLCYGEEPQKQLQEIGRFIVVPLLMVVAFLVVWYAISERVQTKSGKLPNPVETWRSAQSIMEFHRRENDKQRAFGLDGEARLAELERVEKRLIEVEQLGGKATRALARATEEASQRVEAKVKPVQERYDERAVEVQEAQARRTQALAKLGQSAAMGGANERDAYVAKVRENLELSSIEKEQLRGLQADVTAVRSVKDRDLAAAIAAQTAVAERRQYLEKLRDQLTRDNRNEKAASETAKLDLAKKTLYDADEKSLAHAAIGVVRAEDRVAKIEASEYAKPATLPYQVARSVLCVFFGFFLGSAIAIPLGIVCGLSKTCMAAFTPFIAIFKPVSPIVWLPVALIVVGGFIPDPDKHWLTQWLWDLPLIGGYKINPAFIASAATVALCSLWATLVNTAFGVASVDKDHVNVARVLRLGFWDRLFKIVLPSALPLVFAGLRISLGVGWMVLIAAELLASSEGLGKFVWDQFNNGASDSFAKMMVVVFVVGAIGLLLDRMMIVFQRLVSFDGAPTAI